ncbi:hypothetical protein B0H19DRAFT_1062902 [Mycena capillaripes]|nr:hypothetical protein B0H19DRAFT_1062902 [Mycena capillaripes]
MAFLTQWDSENSAQDHSDRSRCCLDVSDGSQVPLASKIAHKCLENSHNIPLRYLGCFTLVQDSASTAADTYTWLGLEATLSLIHMAVWGWNPDWDDPDGITLNLNRNGSRPTFVPDERITDQEVDIIPESRFWQDLTAYCGPLNMDNLERILGFDPWYAWIADEEDETDRLCLVLKGRGSILCMMEKNQNEQINITLYHPQVIRDGHAVQWPFKSPLATSDPLVGDTMFRMALFRHYSFIVSSRTTSSFHIRTSWTLLESGVEKSVTDLSDRPQRDEEMGQQDSQRKYEETWLTLERAVKVLLTGAPQTPVQVDKWFMQVLLFSLKYGDSGDQYLYDRLKKYLEESDCIPNIAKVAPVKFLSVQILIFFSQNLLETRDRDLLEFYDEKWSRYSEGTLQLEHVFASINRGWLRKQFQKGDTSFDTVGQLPLKCWRTGVLDSTILSPQLMTHLKSRGQRKIEQLQKICALLVARHLTGSDLNHMYLGARQQQAVVENIRALRTKDLSVTLQLSVSLQDLVVDLRAIGNHEDALRAIVESVDILDKAVETDPTVTQELAAALLKLGDSLADSGRRKEAVDADKKSICLYRQLVETEPTGDDLIKVLANFGRELAGIARRQEAVHIDKESVWFYCELAKTDTTMRSKAAEGLQDLGQHLRTLGQGEDALVVEDEAIGLFRTLAETDLAAQKNLASALWSFGHHLWDVGRKEDALRADEESIDLYRKLAETDPAARKDLALVLQNFRLHLQAVGRNEDALRADEESIGLYRKLAVTDSAAQKSLAKGLWGLGFHLNAVGRKEDALRADEESIGIYRKLAETEPTARKNLAATLKNFGNHLSAVGRVEDARRAWEESNSL